MPVQRPTLHLLCGKIAAGKSTLARRLAEAPGTILISEDHWMAHLFKEELRTVADYGHYSWRLRAAMGSHVEALLRAGLTVVLDFQANTVRVRNWMRTIYANAGADHRLHVLDVPDEVCLARLRARNAAGVHEFAASDAEFEEITRYYQPPAPEEGFNTVVHRS